MTREEYDRIRDENAGPDNEADAETEAELLEWQGVMDREPIDLDTD